MSTVEFLASAAVGSFLGVIATELFALFKARHSHRLELRSRYFDEKLRRTLLAVKLLKAVTTVFRDLTHDSSRGLSALKSAGLNAERGDHANAEYTSHLLNTLISTLEDIGRRFGVSSRKLDELAKDDATVRSSLGFFYGKRWAPIWLAFETTLDETTDQMRLTGRALADVSTALKEVPPPEFALHLPAMIKRLSLAIEALAVMGEREDAAADVVIEFMRQDFETVAF